MECKKKKDVACTPTIFHRRVDHARVSGRETRWGAWGGGKGRREGDGKREAAGGLQITGCIVLPFDPPVTSTPIDRARVYTAVIARAAEKGAYYPAESEAYWPSAAVTGCIDVYATLSKPRSRPSRGRASYLRDRSEVERGIPRDEKRGRARSKDRSSWITLRDWDRTKKNSAPVRKVVRAKEKFLPS